MNNFQKNFSHLVSSVSNSALTLFNTLSQCSWHQSTQFKISDTTTNARDFLTQCSWPQLPIKISAQVSLWVPFHQWKTSSQRPKFTQKVPLTFCSWPQPPTQEPFADAFVDVGFNVQLTAQWHHMQTANILSSIQCETVSSLHNCCYSKIITKDLSINVYLRIVFLGLFKTTSAIFISFDLYSKTNNLSSFNICIHKLVTFTCSLFSDNLSVQDSDNEEGIIYQQLWKTSHHYHCTY